MRPLTLDSLDLWSPTLAAGAVAAANPNLLLWTEAFDDAVWVKTNVSVTADGLASPTSGNITADLLNFLIAFGTCRQTSTTPATVGAGDTLDIFDVATSWTRYSVTATFDSLPYTFSVQLKQTEAGVGGRLRIDRSGGFIRCSIEDIGDTGNVWASEAQLEQAAEASAYQGREGT